MAQGLSHLISMDGTGWSLATGLSLLVWFIYAPHCLATLATVRRKQVHGNMLQLWQRICSA